MTPDLSTWPSAHTRAVKRRDRVGFSSGTSLFAFDEQLRVLSWNDAAEELTGIPAEEAIGQRCWQVLGGRDDRGELVCHQGCTNARLVLDGFAVSSRDLDVRTADGRCRVALDTIAARNGDRPVFLHVLRKAPAEMASDAPAADALGPPPRLTPRQREVLGLLADGCPARSIARRLGLAEATVRNHIRAVLLELGAHSQLEAVSKARRHRLFLPD
jgi:PAS domain S-box-containing protein